MSEALTLQPEPSTPPAPAAPPAPIWLEVTAAAALIGENERSTRRRCGDTWAAQGLARVHQEPGSKPRWQVRSDAHPALSPSAPSAPSAVKINLERAQQLTDAQRKVALDRKVILDRWRKHLDAAATLKMKTDPATDQFLAILKHEQGSSPSRRTLYVWVRKLEEANGDWTALADARGARPNATNAANAANAAEDPFLAQLKEVYLSRPAKSAQLCYGIAVGQAMQFGWTVPFGIRQAMRWLDKLDPALATKAREGEKAWQDKHAPYMEGDYDFDSNKLWVSDHHEFDVMVKVGERVDAKTGDIVPIYKRPWLTAWMDMRSRKIVGYIVRFTDPNTDAIIEALRLGCLSHGLPEGVYTDNGKDYDSKVLTGITKQMRWQNRKVKVTHDQKVLGGIYAAIEVSHIHALPYHPQSKPIERFFRTVEERFGVLWDTYLGSNPQVRPEGVFERLDKAPDFQTFVESFADWLRDDYHLRIHTGEGMNAPHNTPAAAWETNLKTKRTASDDLINLLMLRRVGPLKVGQNGLTVNNLTYGQSQLSARFGQDVFVRVDPADFTFVTVWTPDDKFIAIADANPRFSRAGKEAMNEELFRAARKVMARDKKAINAAAHARMRRTLDVADLALRAANNQARKAGSPTTPTTPDFDPPSYKPVRSDLEGQLPAVQRAIERPYKKAVGDGVVGTPQEGFDLASLNDDFELSDSQRRPSTPSLLSLVGEE